MKPARKDGLETKRQLVDTAERLFAQEGVEQVTLVDVSREAGQKNRNAAQYHFGDRVGLINAVLDKHSAVIAEQRRVMLDQLEQQEKITVRELVEAQVLPIANHVQRHPNGLTYLMLNRQLISSSEHAALSMRRVDDMPDVIRMQRLIGAAMPPQPTHAIQAKMILIRCMLFNGLANFYDLEPHGDVGHFVDTLCASIVAVILADPC